MVNDYYFNVEYQRFIAGVAGSAPDDAITEVLATALSDTRLGLTQIRRLAARFAIDVGRGAGTDDARSGGRSRRPSSPAATGRPSPGAYAAPSSLFHVGPRSGRRPTGFMPLLASHRPLVRIRRNEIWPALLFRWWT